MGKRVKRGEKAQLNAGAAVRRIMLGGAVGALVCVLALLLCSVFISSGVVGEGVMSAAAPLCGLIGGGAAGVSAVWGVEGRHPAVGLAAGITLFLLLMLAGLLIYEGTTLENGGVGLLLACCCGGALAGLVGRRSGRRRR